MKALVLLAGLATLAGCASSHHVDLPRPGGQWTCLDCDRWGTGQNDLTTPPPEPPVVDGD